MNETITLAWDEAVRRVAAALAAHGASDDQSRALALSLVSAEAEGAGAVGLAHLFAYVDALDAGRADGRAEPVVEAVSDVVTRVDAREGFPHLAVERAWPRLIAAAESQGLGVIALRNGFTSGAIGYFARRLAEEHGLAALVAANGAPAMLPASGGKRPVFCTNPLAFAVPLAGDGAIIVDQSSSAAAYVKIREAAEAGEAIPEGWALDADGRPTTDPAKALEGVLLPFGGARGANIALMVELLAAGLTGAAWAHDAPPFNAGGASPGVGLFILALDPARSGGAGFAAHLRGFVDALRAEEGVYLPGLSKGARAQAARRDGLEVDAALWRRVLALEAAPD